MTTPAESLRRTALHSWHVAQQGRMVDFAGWELPVFYGSGATEEHRATRQSVGLFDIDHMGQIEVRGADAITVVDRLLTADIGSLAVNGAMYGLLCQPDGGVLDDVIVYRTGVETLMVVVNASNRRSDLAWVEAHADGYDTTVADRSDALEMIAIQGPKAVALVDTAAGGGVESLKRFTIGRVELFGAAALVARTGYTGEDGVELYIEGGVTDVWTGLLDLAARTGVDAQPVGLGARDSLRFEAGYPLYGHELSVDINPLEARLSWAVDLTDHSGNPREFIGSTALRAVAEAGVDRRLETMVMIDKGVPREGSEVLGVDDTALGHVVSGMFAPTADVFAANAMLPRTHTARGTDVVINIRGRSKAARVARRPLYRRA